MEPVSDYSCACRTAWLADLGRGEQPVTPATASEALHVGLHIRLGQASRNAVKPIMVRGLHSPWEHEICKVCGYPMKGGDDGTG